MHHCCNQTVKKTKTLHPSLGSGDVLAECIRSKAFMYVQWAGRGHNGVVLEGWAAVKALSGTLYSHPLAYSSSALLGQQTIDGTCYISYVFPPCQIIYTGLNVYRKRCSFPFLHSTPSSKCTHTHAHAVAGDRRRFMEYPAVQSLLSAWLHPLWRGPSPATGPAEQH